MSLIYDCRECDGNEERKKHYGCKENSENPVWETDICFVCYGTDINCPECQGSNHMPVCRCPRAMAQEVTWLLPYFSDWRVSNRCMWPDGGSRLSQPAKLADAFDLLDQFVYEVINESKGSGDTGGNREGN